MSATIIEYNDALAIIEKELNDMQYNNLKIHRSEEEKKNLKELILVEKDLKSQRFARVMRLARG